SRSGPRGSRFRGVSGPADSARPSSRSRAPGPRTARSSSSGTARVHVARSSRYPAVVVAGLFGEPEELPIPDPPRDHRIELHVALPVWLWFTTSDSRTRRQIARPARLTRWCGRRLPLHLAPHRQRRPDGNRHRDRPPVARRRTTRTASPTMPIVRPPYLPGRFCPRDLLLLSARSALLPWHSITSVQRSIADPDLRKLAS